MTTLVQIKRSSANTTPSSLVEGELAYSYVSDKIFIGNTASGVLTIGGKYYTDIVDAATSSNTAFTLVERDANGSAQFSQLEISELPTEDNQVATKGYVDQASGNVSLSEIYDVSVVGDEADQDGRILLGQANGFYVTTSITGNVSISNTGVVTIGSSQVTNSMLANDSVTVTGGAGLSNGGAVALGGSITLDVLAGDGISNTESDTVSVDGTVVRTDRNQTLNGFMTFSNTTTFTSDVEIGGNLTVAGNTTYINVETFVVDDSLLFIGANNVTSDIVDIGLFGTYFNSATSNVEHSGIIRHASDKQWYLFDHIINDVDSNVVDIANSSLALLNANINAQELTVTQLANVTGDLYVGGDTTLSNAFIDNVTVYGVLNVESFISNTAIDVASGGTGVDSFTANAVFYASDSTTLSFATGSEGEVLQISSGVPAFAMLDGGSF